MIYIKLFEDFISTNFYSFYEKVKKLEQTNSMFGLKSELSINLDNIPNIIDIENGLLKYKKGKHVTLVKPSKAFNTNDDKEIDAIATYIMAFNMKDNVTFSVKKGKNAHKLFYTGLENSKYNLSYDCMKRKQCQEYFGIINDNPNQISVLYSFRKEIPSNKNVSGFTILFNINGVIYYDRIYGYTKEDALLIELECNQRGWKNIYDSGYFYDEENNKEKLSIKLDIWKFSKYPYFDSFRYLDIINGILYNYKKNKKLIKLDSTGGGFSYEYEGDDLYINDNETLNFINNKFSHKYLSSISRY